MTDMNDTWQSDVHGAIDSAYTAATPGSRPSVERVQTACVALSEEQACQMNQAIENHKKLEEIVREMREITQTLILETVLGVRRRKPISEIPKAR